MSSFKHTTLWYYDRSKIKDQYYLIVQLNVVEEHLEEDVSDADEGVNGSITAVPSGSFSKPLGSWRRGESSGEAEELKKLRQHIELAALAYHICSLRHSIPVLIGLSHLDQLALQLLHRPQLTATHSLSTDHDERLTDEGAGLEDKYK
ncbi:hypothetical protein PRIPAC_73631 [Pristionchus pacificus]|uniref:Uncharacterized protein n=1 Tax=Pristionchus pacificus TaxID=54126 RepID=A0A2A6BF28_PRIPA|nr:hypothetical protein PRIPAC_73631 [Pristionchus pacificus]|eukprot:PDM64463.1 hypothetical protein PRIPAC_52719 [Pristionchus pacificus]